VRKNVIHLKNCEKDKKELRQIIEQEKEKYKSPMNLFGINDRLCVNTD
jgi:hypothetical protein